MKAIGIDSEKSLDDKLNMFVSERAEESSDDDFQFGRLFLINKYINEFSYYSMLNQKYFYTVLFLDDYYPERDCSTTGNDSGNWKVELPELKNITFTKDTNERKL